MKNKNIIINILIFIFIAIIIYSSYNIINWYLSNQRSKKILDDLSTNITINEDLEDEDIEKKYIIDFNALKEKNRDVVGWIKVRNTNIEYPIVKTSNNDYYLTHSFDKTPNLAGWPFLNYKNTLDSKDKNITVFAHARKDGSMFGSLKNALDENWYSNENNLNIIFITENESSIYKIFSMYKVEDESYYFNDTFQNEKEFKTFLNTIKKRSIHDFNTDLDNVDQILTLSTCDYNDNYRIVVHAMKIINTLDENN